MIITDKLGKKGELCLWILNTAQDIGKLEHRRLVQDRVQISVALPILVYPRTHPCYVGYKNPGFWWRHPKTRTPQENYLFADRGCALFDQLMSKELNKFTPTELGRITSHMCKALNEGRILERALDVVAHNNDIDHQSLQKLVDLIATDPWENLTAMYDEQRYKKVLRLAMSQGCKLHPNQTAALL